MKLTKAQLAQRDLVDRLLELKESGDPEAEELLEELEKEFQKKIDTFSEITSSMNRRSRRSLLKNNRFADRFARTAVKKFKGL